MKKLPKICRGCVHAHPICGNRDKTGKRTISSYFCSAKHAGLKNGKINTTKMIVFVETESMRIARLEQMLKAALDNDDAIVLDENGEPLIFERKDAPKEIEQLRPFGEVDISRELELIKEYRESAK